MQIEVGKTYKLRNGKTVRIVDITPEAKEEYAVMGRYESGHQPYVTGMDGVYFPSISSPDGRDIVEEYTPPAEGYFNVYKTERGTLEILQRAAHPSAKVAEYKGSTTNRVGCIKVIEGQFDE